jgi:hypothetical protein
MIAIILFSKAKRVATLYRSRYLIGSATVAAWLILEVVSRLISDNMNMWCATLCTMGIICFYIMYYWYPAVRMERMKTFAINNMSDPVLMFDYNGNLQVYNESAERMLGVSSYYTIEKYIAETLLNANKSPILWDFNLEPYKTLGEFKLTEQQRAVQELLCNNNVVVLNGPAGSGKTSSVKSLIQMLNDNHLDFLMSCPSAKAAKVLEKYAGFPATTIHRMLGYQSGGFTYRKENPLQADLIIIDESSMLDIFLAKSVLEAIDFNRTKLFRRLISIMIIRGGLLPPLICRIIVTI